MSFCCTLRSWGRPLPPRVSCVRLTSSLATVPICLKRSRRTPARSGAISNWRMALNCPAASCFSSDFVTRPFASATAARASRWAFSTSSTSRPISTRSVSTSPNGARISFSLRVIVSVLCAIRLL